MTVKKMLLTLFTLASLLGVATHSPSQPVLDPFAETIDGTWIVEPNLIGGAAGVQQLITYMRGTLIADAVRPTLCSPSHGTYVRLAYRDFAATKVQWNFDEAGNFTGRTEELQAISVNSTLDGFSGKVRALVFDNAGNLTRTLEGTLRATRVAVKTIE